MPFALPTVLGMIGALTGTAGSIYGMVNQPSAGDPVAAAKAQQSLLDRQDARSRVQAIRSQLSNAQSQTGGSLTDTGNLNLASILAGFPGGTAMSPGAPNLPAMLSNFGGFPGLDMPTNMLPGMGGNSMSGGST